MLISPIATPAQQASHTLHLDLKQAKLKNDLRVILVEDHSAPVVTLCLTYAVGSRNERKGRTGLAHLVEHMMFQGSDNVGKMEQMLLVYNSGGLLDGTTAEDTTFYYETVPSNQLDLVLFLEADRMRSLAITKETFETNGKSCKRSCAWALMFPMPGVGRYWQRRYSRSVQKVRDVLAKFGNVEVVDSETQTAIHNEKS